MNDSSVIKNHLSFLRSGFDLFQIYIEYVNKFLDEKGLSIEFHNRLFFEEGFTTKLIDYLRADVEEHE